nr:serine/threonine protein kinase [Deltaproteobacteria bacterium]
MTARDDRRPGADDRADDRADGRADDPIAAPITPGQLVLHDLGTDSTLDMPAATPERIAAGSLGTANTVGSAPLAGASHGAPRPDGTLDLPASDRVDTADELAAGQVIGHFVIREKLGEGGMGTVLAARDADLGRPVALKVVKRGVDHPAYRARLLREAQVMARLEHPNVLRVYEVGSDRGRLFIAMELVDGVTLAAWLRVQRRPWREVLAMFAQVGAGLAAVHRAGLVHRDFKPDNVLVDREGRARVADFGLARLDPGTGVASPELALSLTRTGVLLGTPGYMAPEQYLDGNVDARADQFSFCVALAEALRGGRGRPKQLEDVHWGDVPRAVREVIARGSSVNAAERFASIDALLAALARAAGHRTLVLG